MEMLNSVIIAASPEVIMDAAFSVERWSEWLPHYRLVRIIHERREHRTVRMEARRGLIPLKWTAEQWRDDRYLRVHFRHIGGPARGMEVAWELTPLNNGSTLVQIRHELSYPVPLVGALIARHIAGKLFISPTASRTLKSFQAMLAPADSRRAN